ncbi:DUF4402 domain-containing protein [Ancylomarina sp. YFZ004]
MKNLIKISAIAIAMFGFAANSFADGDAVDNRKATVKASATIVTPLSITGTAMSFGNIAVQSDLGGTVILSTEGERTTGENGGVSLPATIGDVKASVFNVIGEGTYVYTITMPTADCVLTGDDDKKSEMTINQTDFTCSIKPAEGKLTAGKQEFKVGATLNVSAAQPAGTYTSETGFTVTVHYN